MLRAMQAAQLGAWRRALSTGATHYSPRVTPVGMPLPHGVGLPHRQSLAWRPATRADGGATRGARAGRAANSGAQRVNVGDGGGELRGRLLLSYHDLERALERRGLNRVRVAIGGGLALVTIVAVCWPRIKRWGAAEGAEVAAASLQEQQVQTQAGHTLRAVLQEKGTGEEVRSVLRTAVLELLDDEEVERRATQWAAKVLAEAVMSEEVRTMGERYVGAVLSSEASREMGRAYVGEAVTTVAGNEGVQDVVAAAIWSGVRASLMGRRKGGAERGAKTEQLRATEVGGKNVGEVGAHAASGATVAAGVDEGEQLQGGGHG